MTTLAAGLAVVQAQAATIDFNGNGATTEWSVGTSWVGGNVPGLNDLARLQFGDNATVTTAFNAGGNFNIMARNGALLEIGANFRTILGFDLGTSGDGSVDVVQTAGLVVGRTLSIGNEISTDTYTAKYSVSGGEARWTTVVEINKNGVLEVDGNGGSLDSVGSFTMASGSLSYILAADGVSRIKGNGGTKTFTIDSTLSQLAIDASNYTLGVGQIELALFDTISGSFGAGNIAISGLAEGLSSNITYETVGGDTAMFLNIQAVPEPSSAALLSGCFALASIMVRRRR